MSISMKSFWMSGLWFKIEELIKRTSRKLRLKKNKYNNIKDLILKYLLLEVMDDEE